MLLLPPDPEVLVLLSRVRYNKKKITAFSAKKQGRRKARRERFRLPYSTSSYIGRKREELYILYDGEYMHIFIYTLIGNSDAFTAADEYIHQAGTTVYTCSRGIK